MGIPAPNPSSDCCFSGVTGAAQPVTQPVEIQKPDGVQYVPTSYEETGTCIPLFAKVECADGALIEPFPLGYINENGEFTVAVEITPVGQATKTCEKVDTIPFNIVGPAAAQDYATILAAALAAAPANYPTFGAAAATDEVMAVNVVPTEEGAAFMLNGTEVGGVNDTDGVNLANTIEVPDGCEAIVTFCLTKCLTKAEIAAL